MARQGILAQVVNQGITVHVRHQDIGDNQCRAFFRHSLQCLQAVPGGYYRVAFEPQGYFQQFQDIGDIFDHEQGTGLVCHTLIVASLIVQHK